VTSARVLGIRQLSGYLKQVIETDDLLSDLWVEGEVTKFFVSNAGHVYFTLSDGQSVLDGVVFRQNAGRIRGTIQPGDHITVHGALTIYDARSQYQIRADMALPKGLGLASLQFELLKTQLEAEGLFDPSRKRPIPVGPRVVGVVTSPDAAVWRDIQTAFRRRWPFAHLVLAPTLVQGATAPAAIRSALQRLDASRRCDVIIVARGGGSAEDLSAFNDEALARAAFACQTPIISAIGHETDWTLLDLVADLRAATPTAAAELASLDVRELVGDIRIARERQQVAFRRHVARAGSDLRRLDERVARRSPRRALAVAQRSVAGFALRSRRAVGADLARSQQGVASDEQRVRRAMTARIERLAVRIESREAKLQALDPVRVLGRGYALLTIGDDRRAVTSVDALAPGTRIGARLRDGELDLDITAVRLNAATGGAQ
jgi:exodeoxyribonuclease VII large subunit